MQNGKVLDNHQFWWLLWWLPSGSLTQRKITMFQRDKIITLNGSCSNIFQECPNIFQYSSDVIFLESHDSIWCFHMYKSTALHVPWKDEQILILALNDFPMFLWFPLVFHGFSSQKSSFSVDPGPAPGACWKTMGFLETAQQKTPLPRNGISDGMHMIGVWEWVSYGCISYG